MSGDGDQEEDCIVKLRGLPWSATVDDILKFFNDCDILGNKSGIHMTTARDGRPSGEAFVEFKSLDDLNRAIKKDRENIGSRYIEVFKTNRAEMDWVVKRNAPKQTLEEGASVRLRGLPFECSKEEITQFLTGLEIVPNGITLLTDYLGRSSGEAYVQFISKEVAEKALLKHHEKIGHRYIEIFKSSLAELHRMTELNHRNMAGGGNGFGMGYNSRPSPYDRGDRFGNVNRFQHRSSRSFKGGFFNSNDPERKFFDYNNHQSPWINDCNHNGNMDGDYLNSWDSPRNHNNQDIYSIHMRGLPFKATQMDIVNFFRPIIPVAIRLLEDKSGRPSGEADVDFICHEDAVHAMSKDKENMQHRYIELFLNSSSGGKDGRNNNGRPTTIIQICRYK